MEIINAHVHMVELKKIRNNTTINTLKSSSVFKELKTMLPTLFSKTLTKQMDEAGISKSVLYALYCPIIYASNSYVAKLCKKDEKRRIGFASVDISLENRAEILEKDLKDYSMKGVKFHPPLQNFYPDDKMMYPIYELIAGLNIPVVFHVGTTPFGHLVKLDQANPLLIDNVANNFPKLKIMLTHLGTLWHNEAFMVVEKHPNVYIDTAAYLYEIPEIMNNNLINRVGEEKFIFGTDYPTPFGSTPHRMKDFVDTINSLKISTSMKEKIFSKNFYKLLNDKP
jgi:uncharacterized protein